MADTNIVNKIKKTPTRFEFQQPVRYETYEINVIDADYSGIETVGTHNLVTVSAGQALVGASLMVEDAVTSGGSATVKFNCGDDLTGAIPVANLAAGDVVNFTFGATTGTVATYAKTADKTLNMTVATAALTAGKFVLVLGFIDVKAILENG
jgi:hypothetical protein